MKLWIPDFPTVVSWLNIVQSQQTIHQLSAYLFSLKWKCTNLGFGFRSLEDFEVQAHIFLKGWVYPDLLYTLYIIFSIYHDSLVAFDSCL